MPSPELDLDALARRVADELAHGDRLTTLDPGGDGASPGVVYAPRNAHLAEFIDHTLLKPEATARDIEQLCAEALEHRFAAVCVNPAWVPLCVERLAGSNVSVATVAGFPLGATETELKAAEASRAAQAGAVEIDMVAAIGHIRSGEWWYVADDISAVVDAARAAGGALVKVIIESAALTPIEVVKAASVARGAGAHYVKTSTGFHAAGGATPEAVALMRLVVGDSMGVKAAGGIRDCTAAFRMFAAGATRIGTSSGVAMARCVGTGPRRLADLLSAQPDHTRACENCSGTAGTAAAPGKRY